MLIRNLSEVGMLKKSFKSTFSNDIHVLIKDELVEFFYQNVGENITIANKNRAKVD